jgi:hypothetical protein
MRFNVRIDLLSPSYPAPELLQLAKLNDRDDAIVSCYLDLRPGKPACLDFLNRKASRIRESLNGIARLDFDIAVELIRRRFDGERRAGAQGLAMFARGALSDRQVTLVQTSVPPDNRLVYSRSPEILPLMALRQHEPRGRLLWINGGRFELLLTRSSTHAETICHGELGPRPGCAAAVRQDGASALAHHLDGTRQLDEALLASSSPLLLAGDRAELARLADVLPPDATDRLVGCLSLAPDTDRRSVIEAACERLSALYRAEARRLASRITDEGHGDAAELGFRAVIDSLRNKTVDTVVLSDWDRFGHGLPWEAKVEICFEALRRRVKVILCDSLRLREAGGVGCLLRQDRPVDARSDDAAPDRLRRVA